MQSVTFENRSIPMAGNLYLPPDITKNAKYPAIVVVHPGGGVKEQAAGLYVELLAKEWFVTLAFDSSYQGESGGSPHFLDMLMNSRTKAS
ncbi:MAG: alpha/beta hydrolase [Acetobacteraceae bacterium]